MVEAGFPKALFEYLGDGGGTKQTLQYVAVPGHGRTRWLLPTESKTLGTVLESWTPYRMASRLGWAMVRAASRTGHLAQLPSVSAVDVYGTREVPWRSLGWRWDGQPIPVIYVGTPGPRRKAVVHLVERATAECKALVKVPLTEGAKTAVLQEADILQALEEQRYEAAPRLLFVDRPRGLATQTFIAGQPGARKLTPEHWRLLRSLLLPDQTTTIMAHAKVWQQLIDGPQLPDSVKAALADLHDDMPIPACWEHGDFAPWNIRRMTDGRLSLLDWEDAQRGGLPLSDAFHFLHIQDFLFDKGPRLHYADVYQYAEAFGLSVPLVARLETAYLVSAHAKCVGRKNEPRASFIARTLAKRARWMA
jgi:phosphotransferase family enzyme